MRKTTKKRRVRWLHNACQNIAARIKKNERGSTVVEFAIVAVLVFTMTFAIIEFSRMIFAYHSISNTAREATRYAIVHGEATVSDIITNIPMGLNLQESAMTKSCWKQKLDNDGFVEYGDDNLIKWVETTECNKPNRKIRIQIQYPFEFVVPFLPSTGITLRATSEMSVAQ